MDKANIINNNIQGLSSFSDNQLNDMGLQMPLNWTDTAVWVDPTIEIERIAQPSDLEDPDVYEDMPNYSTEESFINVRGKRIPVIRINGRVIPSTEIEHFEIKCTGFLPEISLTVSRMSSPLNLTQDVGINNFIQVVIMPMMDGKYKSYQLRFYVTDYDVNVNRTKAYYKGVYDAKALSSSLVQSRKVKFGGYVNLELGINKPPNPNPTTWELMYTLATETGLGFQSTTDCVDIDDRLKRIQLNGTNEKFIKEQISISGIGNGQLYDAWVDFNNYLILVNLPWVMDANITPANLSIYAETGFKPSHTGMGNNEWTLSRRVLTNFGGQGAVSNLMVEEVIPWSDLNDIYNNGNCQYYYSANALGVGEGNNSFSMSNVESVERSVDGYFKNEYQRVGNVKSWVNLNEEYDCLAQRERRDAYMKTVYTQGLIVTLRYTNFGIQRGSLVYLGRFVDDMESKMTIQATLGNAVAEDESTMDDTTTIPEYTNDGDWSNKDVQVGRAQIEDISQSGLYYVNGIVFTYDRGNDKLKQTLYLIKKGAQHTYYPIHGVAKVNTEQL